MQVIHLRNFVKKSKFILCISKLERLSYDNYNQVNFISK